MFFTRKTECNQTIDNSSFIQIIDYIPDIIIDLKYATIHNFTRKKIYFFSDAYLRYGTLKKLFSVQNDLRKLGYRLKIWDAYRPISAQFDLWAVCPNPLYVADPNKGFSSHSKGNTVDVTLVDIHGVELSMPTAFDDFSALKNQKSVQAVENAALLKNVMVSNGFNADSDEWWHFSDTEDYPVNEYFIL